MGVGSIFAIVKCMLYVFLQTRHDIFYSLQRTEVNIWNVVNVSKHVISDQNSVNVFLKAHFVVKVRLSENSITLWM